MAVLLFVGCASSNITQRQQGSPHVFAVGECLEIATPNGRLHRTIAQDGTLTLPLDVRIVAAGFNSDSIAAEIRDAFKPDGPRSITVDVCSLHSPPQKQKR